MKKRSSPDKVTKGKKKSTQKQFTGLTDDQLRAKVADLHTEYTQTRQYNLELEAKLDRSLQRSKRLR